MALSMRALVGQLEYDQSVHILGEELDTVAQLMQLQVCSRSGHPSLAFPGILRVSAVEQSKLSMSNACEPGGAKGMCWHSGGAREGGQRSSKAGELRRWRALREAQHDGSGARRGAVKRRQNHVRWLHRSMS